jgi:uncharacterized Zn-finger protein
MTNILIFFLAFVTLANPTITKPMDQLVKKNTPKKIDFPTTEEKPFRCTLCPKTFTQPYKLRDHRRIHTGERPFQCTLCPKAFKLKQTLKEHTRSHTKPFQCTLCPISFARNTTLKNHIRTHTGEKLFQCILCPKSFAVQNSLKRHINSIHIQEALSSETNYQPATNNRTPQNIPPNYFSRANNFDENPLRVTPSSKINHDLAIDEKASPNIPDMSCNNYLFFTNDFDKNPIKKHLLTTDKNLPQQEIADFFAHQNDLFEREYIAWLDE